MPESGGLNLAVGTGRDFSSRSASVICARILLIVSAREDEDAAVGGGSVVEGAGTTRGTGVVAGVGVAPGG